MQRSVFESTSTCASPLRYCFWFPRLASIVWQRVSMSNATSTSVLLASALPSALTIQPETSAEVMPQMLQSLRRHIVSVPTEADDLRWIAPESDTDWAFFARASDAASSASEANVGRQAEYYTLTEGRAIGIATAAAELHSMFEAATSKVLEDDALLETFGIPVALHAKVKHSFVSHRSGAGQHSMMGRLDLAMDDHEVKAYEYNADSASCLYECGYAQERWANAVGLVGSDPGQHLGSELTAAWRDAGIPAGAKLHLMLDDDLEEAYHARYVRDAAQEAGIRTKLIKGVEGMSWGPEGEVMDDEGERVQFVWKTWAWETVIDDYRSQTATHQHSQLRPVLLSDVLLADGVTVWEPLWTVITSCKAILPVLWQMFPGHPHLLQAEFELSTALRNHPAGYVTKPIGGRCGKNVTMVKDGAVVASLGGGFDAKPLVYQELRPLPRMDGFSVLMCPWLVRGKCAGLVLRVDKKLITGVDSPIEVLRIVPL
mmetsp:Transcript_8952/g.31673  ORF Transcript_8952/g.31673 Transcript_8952/m.31673 type:complete len:487 (-) Transcript_8952:313-1773(-)